MQSDDLKTFVQVADAEFFITRNTVTMQLPTEVPNVLVPVLNELMKQDLDLFARVLGEGLMYVMHTKVLNESSELWERLTARNSKGGP